MRRPLTLVSILASVAFALACRERPPPPPTSSTAIVPAGPGLPSTPPVVDAAALPPTAVPLELRDASPR